jgi:16S rRNA (uracil1498-N3)-methyltransferase
MTPDWPRDRFYVDQDLYEGLRIELSEQISQQISRVLRLREDEEIVLFSGNGHDHVARIVESGRKRVVVDVTERSRAGLVYGLPRIHLGLALIKSDRFDLAVQKATELGVSAITPIETDRSVVSLPADRVRSRVERWQRIAFEALEQSERSDRVEINHPIAFSDFVAGADGELKLIAAERTGWTQLPNVLTSRPASVDILIGPEGGFSARELDQADSQGWTAVTLAPAILRSETATIASMAMIRALTSD